MSCRLQGWRVQGPALEFMPLTMHNPPPFQLSPFPLFQISTSDAVVPLNPTHNG